ncbi:MAG: 50S ribosomal protein L20 [Candidatus Portnoybacteria bacterium CG_4_8_14_3_um_filter_44_15]|uniref:Large ribosomal subunit protein bL20 n=4 Tax=Candidatus Portnoyibacteriota TaxID=1817913 RepID=A0A2M7YM25_9BACT|nr:MAG: 50S ribosomal protein L20 [Parcubacteria group bacterium CG1_02_44_65]PIP15893.1 MAG: 50S ribosomal protein L20 [Candidatus Portnoybacteria bacterium CG23_combo_of_CG06-09_8_20_14_all_44_36]PIW74584.1 MAG: 50S ribosomal protein L20 [Candidatus Portnoybacteria bacterium CG_4_8_14_3_um_filter_44_15]PIZ69717.1 MAG: 50S ribosomal protein L20 [Candidatus Portnoybacteria bacterium CG_4_10_14_0_2_um_filter_43_36]PJA64038.1 MAG: 50S ribosomal protein L20 [Candidatus Portnoybacteria bacterium CG
MTRVKRGTTANKRRKKIIKMAKGFKWGRKAKYKAAKDALRHAWTYAFRDRKRKKRDFRQLWNIKINAASRERDLTYSQFINRLKKAKIEIDRKILAQLAEKQPEIFSKIIERVK